MESSRVHCLDSIILYLATQCKFEMMDPGVSRVKRRKRPRSVIQQTGQNEYASELVQYYCSHIALFYVCTCRYTITLPGASDDSPNRCYTMYMYNQTEHTRIPRCSSESILGPGSDTVMLQGWRSIEIDVSPSSYLCKAPAPNKMTNIDSTSRPRFMGTSPRITCAGHSSINRTAAIHVVGSKRGLEPIKNITSERFRNSKSRADVD